MDTLMLAVAGLSLAMATAMGFVVLRLLREERRRSDARVAALTEMAAEPAPRVRTALDDFEIRPTTMETTTGAGELFSGRHEPSPWARRLGIVGILSVLVIALVVGVRSTNRAGDGAVTATAPAPAPVAENTPLELLSLGHTQAAGSLIVTGLVQNPRSGVPLARVVATALVFGPEGAFLASARAPLDVTVLTPGDESPFVVTVPVAGDVTRYRIGFRSSEGHVIAHVDRRAPRTAASR